MRRLITLSCSYVKYVAQEPDKPVRARVLSAVALILYNKQPSMQNVNIKEYFYYFRKVTVHLQIVFKINT